MSDRPAVSEAPDDSIQARIAAVEVDALAPPTVDPQVAALAGMALVDLVRSDSAKARFAELAALGGFDLAAVTTLERLAKALLHILDLMDRAPRTPAPVMLPPALAASSHATRAELISLLDSQLGSDPVMVHTIAQIRLGHGLIDCAQDLRALARLAELHRDRLQRDNAWDQTLVDSATGSAREIETTLFAHDTPELREARLAMQRVWVVYEAAYEEVARVGRELFAGDDPQAKFPALASIAETRRGVRRSRTSRSSQSLRAVKAPILDEDAVAAKSTSVPPTDSDSSPSVDDRSSAPSIEASFVADSSPLSARDAAPASSPRSARDEERGPELEVLESGMSDEDVAEIVQADHWRAAFRGESEPPPSLRSAPPSSRPAVDTRESIDVELSATSLSNLYMGLSDDVVDAGVFVATYATLKVGTPVILRVTTPESPEPNEIDGVVHWVRPKASWDDYLPSGMGIELETLSPPARMALERMLKMRTPLFYDD